MIVTKDTRMKTDTCGCITIYDAKLDPPRTEPDIINIRFEHTCPLHAGIDDYKDRFEAVLALNRAKNGG